MLMRKASCTEIARAGGLFGAKYNAQGSECKKSKMENENFQS